jgi:hypothetical protein
MAYITIANANSIIFNSDHQDVEFVGKIYKIPIYFFSNYEKNSLLAIKELLTDPENYFTEIYKPHKAIDTFTLVYEGRPPAYHAAPDCSFLNADYENFEIPADIFDKGKEEVLKFRLWFNSVKELYDNDPPAFVARLMAKWGINTNVNALKAGNSGQIELENKTVEAMEQRIDAKIKAAGQFYYSSEKAKAILKQFSKYAFLGRKSDPINNNRTGYSDDDVKQLLRYYDRKFKQPLKHDLIEYYRLKLNPEINMEGYILENLGFKPCGHCHNHRSSIIRMEITGASA